MAQQPQQLQMATGDVIHPNRAIHRVDSSLLLPNGADPDPLHIPLVIILLMACWRITPSRYFNTHCHFPTGSGLLLAWTAICTLIATRLRQAHPPVATCIFISLSQKKRGLYYFTEGASFARGYQSQGFFWIREMSGMHQNELGRDVIKKRGVCILQKVLSFWLPHWLYPSQKTFKEVCGKVGYMDIVGDDKES